MKFLLIPVCMAALLGAGCGSQALSERRFDPLSEPRFLRPIAESQEAGVQVYWMGETFGAGSLLFELNAVADATPIGDDYPGLGLLYGAVIGRGVTTFSLQSLPKEGGGPAEMRRRLDLIPANLSPHEVQVGNWQGQLILIPSVPGISGSTPVRPLPPRTPSRPVNQALLVVDIGDTAVYAQASSGSTGVPGDDVNPLIDSDLLIEVVAEHLRLYTE